MTPEDRECLGRIKAQYGVHIDASAARHTHRPEVLAGIILRETRGGESKLLDKPGPEGRGDLEIKHMPDGSTVKHYHAFGLCQIDDRSFPEFCAGEDWKDPAKNIEKAADILQHKRIFLSMKTLAAACTLPPDELERATVAAYNAGEGTILKAIKAGNDVDARTANHDYAKCVLEYAEAYRQL